MTRIKIHISNVKLPFYPPCEVKCGLQNEVSTLVRRCIIEDSLCDFCPSQCEDVLHALRSCPSHS